MSKNTTDKKLHNIEAIRFLFSVMIVFYHVLYGNIMPYVNEQPLYTLVKEKAYYAQRIVEFFLLMGGYFLYQSLKKSEKSFIEFAIDRVVRLWPVLTFSVIISVIFFRQGMEDGLLDIFFLRCTGISLTSKGIIWYIGPFFWASLLIYALLKNNKQKMSRGGISMAIMAYCGYCININYCNGGLGRDVVFSFFSLGFLRVLAGLSAGCLIGMVMDAYKRTFQNAQKSSACTVVAISVVEIVTLGILLCYLLLGMVQFKNSISPIIVFSLLFVCMLSNEGIVSRILNRKIFSVLGRYAYSIYVMQQISFNILARTFWKNTDFLYNHVFWSICITLVFSVGVGIIVYHLIEQPFMKIYRNWKKKRIY